MENISEEEFCLKRKNFEAILSQSFSRFRDQSLFFDCTLATEDYDGILIYSKAHKIILASCSEFFSSILAKEDMAVHSNPVIYLGGIPTDDLKNIMDFIYNGEVKVTQRELDMFLKAADTLKIKSLMNVSKMSSDIESPAPIPAMTRAKKRAATSLPSIYKKIPNLELSALGTNLKSEEIDKVKSKPAYSAEHQMEDRESEEDNIGVNQEVGQVEAEEPCVGFREDNGSDHCDSDIAKGQEDAEDIDNPIGFDAQASGQELSQKVPEHLKKSRKIDPNQFHKKKFTEKREKIAELLKEGKRPREIMQELLCNEKLVYKVRKLLKDNESLTAWY